ncbi:hypothetical protein KP509_04G040200 [Ceratopteris richardii]|uniref:Uncharacterized protein n=1 Tax=Ceratopteris richardii TaxID=49495 RepID=A0A8T2US88_CERRI|nr:hypothetical protein KP509_04G040200 [Ceratopteris richardii]
MAKDAATCSHNCTVTLAVLAVAMTFSHLQFLMCSAVFTPPPGNSLAMRAIVLDGKLKYVCSERSAQWRPLHVRATLLSSENHTKVIGFYSSNHNIYSSSSHTGTWTLKNNEGDMAESNHATSLVAGRRLVSTNDEKHGFSDFLAEASSHLFDGSARRVSYISQTKTKLLKAPSRSRCRADTDRMISIPFTAVYNFWTQDTLPPQVPRPLMVPTEHHVVQGFFAKGVVRFRYDNNTKSWREYRVLARLYDVPGGLQLGGFSYSISSTISSQPSYSLDSPSLACININNPNGIRVCGKQKAVTSSSSQESSLPWRLFQVTTSSGYMQKVLGPFSFIQMLSTWGGLPPQTSTSKMMSTPYGWKSQFSSILWIYTKSRR